MNKPRSELVAFERDELASIPRSRNWRCLRKYKNVPQIAISSTTAPTVLPTITPACTCACPVLAWLLLLLDGRLLEGSNDEIDVVAEELDTDALRQDVSVPFVTLNGSDDTEKASIRACSLYDPARMLTFHSHDKLVGLRLLARERLREGCDDEAAATPGSPYTERVIVLLAGPV